MHKGFLRHTLKRTAVIEGRGIHTGTACRVKIIPENTGGRVIFIRGKGKIPASLEFAYSPRRFTGLKKGGAEVLTVEHFLSACFALSVTDACVVVEGESGELPVLDGSAKEFLVTLRAVGLEPVKETGWLNICVKKEKSWDDGSRYRAREHKGLAVRCTVEYPEVPSIGIQSFFYEHSLENFEREIAPAKTFATSEEVEHLRKKGLIAGGTLENALVYSKEGLINPQSASFPDEPVRHKLLDFLGDLYLLSPAVRGIFDIKKPGHARTLEFLLLLNREGAVRT